MTDAHSLPTSMPEDNVCSLGELSPKKPPQSVAWPGLAAEKPEAGERLGEVAGMSRRRLQSLWRELFPTAAHPRLSRSLLVSIISYRLQEEWFGGISSLAQAQLRAICRARDRKLTRDDTGRSGSTTTKLSRLNLRQKKPPMRVQLNPGTRLLREWRGHTYIVLVVEEGYQFQDARYGSLSEIARRITGSRWSGPLFFGLKPGSAGPKFHRVEEASE